MSILTQSIFNMIYTNVHKNQLGNSFSVNKQLSTFLARRISFTIEDAYKLTC